MENINTLPKWAQSKIRSLENKILEQKIIIERNKPSPVSLNTMFGEPKVYLPNETIVFELSKDKHERKISVRLSDEGQYLKISTSTGCLNIEPIVTNVIHVTEYDR
jgi:hypothetical protein